jgi:hypothetical protein
MHPVVQKSQLSEYVAGIIDPPVGPESGLGIQFGAIYIDVDGQVAVIVFDTEEIRAGGCFAEGRDQLQRGGGSAEQDGIVFLRLEIIQQTFMVACDCSCLVLEDLRKQARHIAIARAIGAGQLRNRSPRQIRQVRSSALRLNMELRASGEYLQLKSAVAESGCRLARHLRPISGDHRARYGSAENLGRKDAPVE